APRPCGLTRWGGSCIRDRWADGRWWCAGSPFPEVATLDGVWCPLVATLPSFLPRLQDKTVGHWGLTLSLPPFHMVCPVVKVGCRRYGGALHPPVPWPASFEFQMV